MQDMTKRPPKSEQRVTEMTPARIVFAVSLVAIGLFAGILVGYALYPVVAARVPNIPNPQATETAVSTTSLAPTTPPDAAVTPFPSPTLGATVMEQRSTPPPPTAASTAVALEFSEGSFEYGRSANDNPLVAYRLGNGPSARLIVGAIHGGYELNTAELVSETLEYYQTNPDQIPPSVTLYLVPVANPDGAVAGTDAVVGRMNGHGVDLNRNWDYQHQITATHGTREVSAGEYAFSEPETDTLRQLIESARIELVIFYHSAYGGVVFSGAEPENSATRQLADMLASEIGYGYRHMTEGIPGQITTGDSIDWLSAKKGIAGAEIELTTHGSILGTPEYDANLQGIQAFLEWEIPGVGPASSGEEGDTVYTVQKGDTIYAIISHLCDSELSLQEYVDLAARIVEVNQLADVDDVYPGQELTILGCDGDE